MEECTIQFKECPKGHGWLTAANWVQHGCPTCKLAAEREACAKIADQEFGNKGDDVDTVLTRVAEAIRKRGKP